MAAAWVAVLAQVNTATISGTVQDESGAVIPGVAITVRNVDTGLSRSLSSDAEGRYRAPNLPIGNYEVEAQTAGDLHPFGDRADAQAHVHNGDSSHGEPDPASDLCLEPVRLGFHFIVADR